MKKKVLDPHIEAGSKESKEPRLLGSIVSEMLHGNSPLAIGYRQYIASQENTDEADVWNRNTDLCMDVKTFLRNDRITKIGKSYPGVLERDAEDHYVFIETLPQNAGKRNPRIFDGKYLTVTRRDDGSYRPNFKPIKVGVGFSVDGYAIGVCNELREALSGLVEK